MGRYITEQIRVTNGDYLKENIIDFFNIMLNRCITVSGSRPLEKNLIKDIISVQFHAINKTVFIETPEYNYVLTENNDGNLRLCEYYRSIEDKKAEQ